MRALVGGLALLLLLLSPIVAVDGAPKPKHDESVADLIEYFTTNKGVFYSPKQQIRRENGMMGVFATERITKGELLCSVPWDATINAGRPIKNPTHLVCDTVRSLVREMKLGDKSEFGPYVKYLLEQRRGQLPSAWSPAAKALLRRVLDDDHLPPQLATSVLDHDWHQECGGKDDPFDNNAAMLVIQRAEDDLMVPVYDFYNHRNGEYLNTVNHRRHLKSFDVTAGKDIEVGEQIYISYNMCSNCGNRANDFGTPEMFRDYGFVEAMPQRWTFPDHGFVFDLQEKEPGSPSGLLEISYPQGGRNFHRPKRQSALNDFGRQVRRLEKLKRMEAMNRKNASSSSEAMSISDHEWDAIWRYSDALVNAMKHLIKEELGSDKEGELSNLYDSLTEIEPEDTFYKASPVRYTASCDNAELMQFDGHTTLEEADSLYQEVSFFDMPDGDICLEIDLTIQTCAKYRPHYHELVVDIPARYIDMVRRVLFVGGGDSMILAEALKYPNLELVVGLELDQAVVRKSFKYFHTQPHFDDKRVQWWFGDAVKSLKLLPKEYFGSFDLVLVDLSETVASFTVSKRLDMVQALALLLHPQGIMIKNEWVYLEKMSSIFQYTARLNMQDVPLMCDQALTMGSQMVDFLRHKPIDHNVTRRLLGPQVDIDDRFYMFHDYQKNILEAKDTCDELEESSSDQEDASAGVLLVLNAEDTSIPLTPFTNIEKSIVASFEREGLTLLSTFSSLSKEDGSVAAFVLQEGYITARTWPKDNYCAFDIHLWGGFSKHESIRDALLKVVGSVDGSWSSYRVVGGGMRGSASWDKDQKMIGPRFAHAESCNAATTSADEDKGVASHLAAAETVLKESMELIQSKDDTVVLAVCGAEGKPCLASDVISTAAKDAKKVATQWACAKLASYASFFSRMQNRKIDCENQVLHNLSKIVSASGKIGAVVVDESAPMAMIDIVNSIFSSKLNMDEILADEVSFMALMADDRDTMKRKHNFLDRIRKEIGSDPISKAEIVLDSAEGQMEMGILSIYDRQFFPRLYNVTKQIEANAPVDVKVRKVLGGRWEEQYGDEFKPREYKLEDYDVIPGQEQFRNQKPMGRQIIFQLAVNEGNTITRADIESALSFTFFETNLSEVKELETVIEVGDGFVTTVHSSQGSAIVLWDGDSNVHINLFLHDDSSKHTKTFIEKFMGKVPMQLIQRDEQPRGIGRVVNFSDDIAIGNDDRPTTSYVNRRIAKYFDGIVYYGTVTEYDSNASGRERWHVKYDDGDEENLKRQELEDALHLYHELASPKESQAKQDMDDANPYYECPTIETGSSQNDIAGYFNYYNGDHERHATNTGKDKDYYTKGFRDASFGGRAWTYSTMKEEATEYKAKYYGDSLEDGDWIYEGASGEAFNLLMTIEILAEERGIKNLRAFGSDYLAKSAKVANDLFDAQAAANSWIKKGQFCQGDSTDLSFVPANTFDLAFTYVDPLVDSLKRHGHDVSFDDRVEKMKELCGSTDDDDQDIVARDQKAQEDWHSSWVKELIRITKPGKAIIIEDVDTPVCNESSEWGGVSTEWWKNAVAKYDWEVDPNSIDIVEAAWYGHRYNVFMRKNDGVPKKKKTKRLSRDKFLKVIKTKGKPIDTCPSSHWNEEMNVHNVMEFDVDTNVIEQIWQEYEADVRPHLKTGNSTDDFCLVTPYNPETVTWTGTDHGIRSDIKWYSTRNEKTFNKYAKFVDALGLMDLVKDTWIEDPVIYSVFFIPRSHSEKYQFHEDWADEARTQIMTMLVPLNKFDIHLKYYDADDEVRGYEYKYGKGIAFAGGFIHSTGLGDGEEEDVLLCVYLGSRDSKIFEIAKMNIGDESEYYNSPIKGYVRNENFPNKKICQYGAPTKYPWKDKEARSRKESPD